MTDQPATTSDLVGARPFVDRHIGPDDAAIAEMLKVVGFDSLESLMEAAVPGRIRATDVLSLPTAASEAEAAAELVALAGRNVPGTALIGLGYHGTITPPVIRRNVLEDPSWYTAYTPYQPEISQG
ncbi:MAG: glycine dehydrogenase (aminomethyl-transferring), partial [Marmoricola sp.]